jgi:hypothetical protein
MDSGLHKVVEQAKESDLVDINMTVRDLDEQQADILSLSGDQRRWVTVVYRSLMRVHTIKCPCSPHQYLRALERAWRFQLTSEAGNMGQLSRSERT